MFLNFVCIIPPVACPYIQLLVGHKEDHSQLKNKILHIHSKLYKVFRILICIPKSEWDKYQDIFFIYFFVFLRLNKIIFYKTIT